MPQQSRFSVWSAVGLGASFALFNGCGALHLSRREAQSSTMPQRSVAAAPAGNATLYRQPTDSPAVVKLPVLELSTPPAPPESGLGDHPVGLADATPPASPPVSINPDSDPLGDWRSAGVKFTPADAPQPVTIDATDRPIEDRHLAALPSLPELRHLNLRGTQVTDSGVAAISRLTELEFLGLSHTAVTDAGVPSLAGLHKLRYLTLADTDISDRSVPTLGSLASLQGLNVKGTALTAAGVSQLRARLPNCKLVFDESLLAAELQFDRELSAVGRSVGPQLLGPAGRLPTFGASHLPADAPSAEQRLAQLLEERIGDPELLATLGDLCREQGDLTGAVMAYRESLRRDPLNLDLRFKLGVAEAEQGDWQSSRTNLAAAVGPAAAEYNHAVLLYQQGRHEECHAALARALQWEPEFPPAHQLAHRLEQPGHVRLNAATAPPATLQLLHRALRSESTSARDSEWKVAIQPQSHGTPPTSSPPVNNVHPALHEEPVQAGRILNGGGERRYDW